MKKAIRFSILKVDFCVTQLNLLCLLIIYFIGLLLSCFIKLDLQDKLFSPVVVLNFSSDYFRLLFHNILYFYIFPTMILFCSTSFFGFMLIPILILVKAFFSGVTVYNLFLSLNYAIAFGYIGVILTLESFILLFYSTQAIRCSLELRKFKANDSFDLSLRQSYIVYFFSTVMAVTTSFFQYFF